MSQLVRAYVGLGGNIGESAAIVRAAADALDALPSTRLVRLSRLYRTPAWGPLEQADFTNAAAAVDTSLDAHALLRSLLDIERAAGRDRTVVAPQWGPRTLDLDLLLHGQQTIDDVGLRIPHPHMHARAFVLVPLMEIAPDLVIPGLGTVRDAHRTVAKDGIEALL